VLPAELKTEVEWEAKQESGNRGKGKEPEIGDNLLCLLCAFRQSPAQPGPALQKLMALTQSRKS
jgi:hypothetical protein